MVRSEKARIRVTGLQPVQMVVGLVGLAFLVAGIVGFTRTGFANFAGQEPWFLSVFAINPLHNLINVVLGLIGVLMSIGSGLARTYGWLLLIATGGMFVWGMMITGMVSSNPVSGAGNPLNLNSADNWLHLGLAVLGLVIAVMPARKVALVERDEVVNDDTSRDGSVRDDSVRDDSVRDRKIHDKEARDDSTRTDEIPVAAGSSSKSGGWKHAWRRHPAN
ncbi:DUF4383 domain-containing protein [Amycolatopsis sp.]|jgi:hypothetical protein|uniref:DUF4383 domain-containing protein n=1 Tax=Amycolatopsis sp. TaxID=37632 RepID=UPI002E058F2C|nr:DUF4383 domain-containing protein [Amycolatopsis sp.]